MTTSSAPTPQELGRLFAEVFDLCDQVAASITDTEVDAKLSELLAMRRPAAPLAPSDPAPDIDLDAMYAAELPPCEIVYQPPGAPKPPSCGRPSTRVVTLRCADCGTRQRPCCDEHHRALVQRFEWFKRLICGLCGGVMLGMVTS